MSRRLFLPQPGDLKKYQNRAEILPRREAMTGLSICVGGWLVLNVVFAALMLRRDRPVLREAQPTDSPSWPSAAGSS